MAAFFTTLLALVVFILLINIYFWPLNIALRKNVEDKWAVFIINLVLAWTIIGWIICLMWTISLNDERTAEEKEQHKNAESECVKILKKYWKVILAIIVLIAIIAGVSSNFVNENTTNSTNDNTSYEQVDKAEEVAANKYTNCELGDLLGDDVKTINYKNLIIDYHSTDFTEKQIKELASACYKDNATTQEQMSCCMSYKMYPNN